MIRYQPLLTSRQVKFYDAGMTERSAGVLRAIEAAGGIGALARALGIDIAAVSRWENVPPLRVLAVERITGVSRTDLRPDLYPSEAAE